MTILTNETIFDNWKDSPGDLTFETLITILTIENLNSDNHSYLTINCDTGQHSQFLRCFVGGLIEVLYRYFLILRQPPYPSQLDPAHHLHLPSPPLASISVITVNSTTQSIIFVNSNVQLIHNETLLSILDAS